MASIKNELQELVGRLRTSVIQARLDASVVAQETKLLAAIEYAYDAAAFPPLGMTDSLSTACDSAPESLAEALLWKMGRWKAYQNFVASYAANKAPSGVTDVVFSAFAKHLRNQATDPIYDQHALRAVVAICDLGATEIQACRSVLAKKNGTWKSSGSGKHSLKCYELFTVKVAEFRSFPVDMPVGLSELDRLLMPLGQALKVNYPTFSEFESACLRPRD